MVHIFSTLTDITESILCSIVGVISASGVSSLNLETNRIQSYIRCSVRTNARKVILCLFTMANLPHQLSYQKQISNRCETDV